MIKLVLASLVFSLTALAGDPNLQSYKSAGECSDHSREKCAYCPIKKKFIALSSNSKDQTPKDEDYEFVDPSRPEEGAR